MSFNARQFAPSSAVSRPTHRSAPNFPFTAISSYSLYEEAENSLGGLLRSFADHDIIAQKIREDRGVDLDTKNNLAYILADAIKVNPNYTRTILYIISKMKPYQRLNLIMGILKFSGPLCKYNSPDINLNEQQIIIFGAIYSYGIGEQVDPDQMPAFVRDRRHANSLTKFFNETHYKALPDIISERLFSNTGQDIPEITRHITDYAGAPARFDYPIPRHISESTTEVARRRS
jgi:hypothetical protein